MNLPPKPCAPPSAWSLKRRLFALVLATMVGLWVISAVIIHRDAERQSGILFDQSLEQSAHLLLALAEHEGEEINQADLYPLADSDAGARSQRIYFQIRNRDGMLLFASQGAPALPFAKDGAGGFGWMDAANGRWRTYTTWNAARHLQVQIGEPAGYRREISGDFAGRIFVFAALTVPFMSLLLGWVIHRAIAPIQKMAQAVAARAPEDTRDVDPAGAPAEVQPLIAEINHLLAMMRCTLENERRFTADAAHELRTPLAAVRAHVQVLGRARDAAEQREAVADAIAGVDRSSHLVDQLLTLARLDRDGAQDLLLETVDVALLAREQCEEHAQAAGHKGVELDCIGEMAMVKGDALSLGILLRNLIDNAIRYTPAGGRVEVVVAKSAQAVTVAVRDNGPGVATEHRERIFDRFFRVVGAATPGSGLGLSIVRSIAVRHGAFISTGAGLSGRGIAFVVAFPLHPAAGGARSEGHRGQQERVV